MSVKDNLILVSAGHTNVAGSDQGAAGNGFIEGREAVKIRDAVAAELRKKGVSVIEDGADGVSEPLKKAIVLARRADTAIEIHFNAGGAGATGIEVLSKLNNKVLAKKLASAIHIATGIKLRGEAGWKSDSSGQHHRLGFCEAGGLIIEVCFISNLSDMRAYEANFRSLVSGLANVLAGSPIAIPLKSSTEQEPAGSKNGLPQQPAIIAVGSPEPEAVVAPASAVAGEGESQGEKTATEMTATSASQDGTQSVEVVSRNEQDVNIPAKIAEPSPYNEIGFFATIKRDLLAVTGGNIGFESLSSYAQQASGWPAWLVSIVTKLALIALLAGVAYLVFRVIHFGLDSWKKNKRVEHEIAAKTDITRRDVEWTSAK